MTETTREATSFTEFADMLDATDWDQPTNVASTETTTPAAGNAPQTAYTPPAPSKRASLEAFAAVKTLADILNDEVKNRRAAITRMLADEYKAEGTTKRAVKLPDGTTVAHVILNEPSPKTATADAAALIEWASTHAPELLDTVEHPAQEAWTETVVKPDALAALVESAVATEDGAVVTAEGEIIPGVKHTPAPEPSSFSVRYATGGDKRADPLAGGRRMILDAIEAGEIDLDEARARLHEITR
ncbi:hypothetical protein D9R06_09880 [Kocuria marina subsp. indica]|uniref:hypothetical protein n=1 Tax=Kocuria marina TaxID=223184 RepID=UPI000EF203EC|nr:hypothetical protein [Kocuria indica]RLP57280.1 hypothetical protein D9R06_09880 [Kocuria indica]